jgi:hypothetical protein
MVGGINPVVYGKDTGNGLYCSCGTQKMARHRFGTADVHDYRHALQKPAEWLLFTYVSQWGGCPVNIDVIDVLRFHALHLPKQIS